MDRIKRLSFEVLNDHKTKFGEDFTENKKAHNKYTARMTNKKIYESSNFTKKDYNNSLRVDSLKNQIIEKNYFREFNSYQDYRTIIKKRLGNL